MPNILDRYAHDYRDMKMSEKELKLLLKLFVMELLPGKQPMSAFIKTDPTSLANATFYRGYNKYRQEVLKKIGEK